MNEDSRLFPSERLIADVISHAYGWGESEDAQRVLDGLVQDFANKCGPIDDVERHYWEKEFVSRCHGVIPHQ